MVGKQENMSASSLIDVVGCKITPYLFAVKPRLRKISFLIAVLQTNWTLRQRTVRQIEEALVDVPQDLSQFYERTLGRIKQQPHPDRKLAFRVFRWISHASADLTIDQLIHALSLEWGAPVDRSHSFDVKNLYRLADVVDVCLGLINVEAHDRSVRFTHDTVKEYLTTNTSRLWEESPSASIHGELAATCLTYMAFDDFGEGPCTSQSDFIALTKFYCLLPYAMRYVGSHLRKTAAMDKAMLLKQFERLLKNDMKRLLIVQVGLYFVGMEPVFESDRCVLAKNPWINLVTDWGYLPMVENALRRGYSLEPESLTSQTPLHVAASNGDLELVRYMLRLEVDSTQGDWRGHDPAMLAALKGHSETFKCLTERGSNSSKRDLTGNTSLAISVYSNQRGILSYIMQQNPKPRFEDWYRAMWFAVGGDNSFLTSLQLLKGLDGSIQREYLQRSLIPMIRDSYNPRKNIRLILSIAKASRCDINIEETLENALESDYDQSLALYLLELSGTMYLPDPSGVICLAVSMIQDWNKFLNRSPSSKCGNSNQRKLLDIIDLLFMHMRDRGKKRYFESLLANNTKLAFLESVCQDDVLPIVRLLCIACRLGDSDVTRSLAKRTSNLDEKYKGSTPLENAALKDHCTVVELMLDLGAKDLEGAMRVTRCARCALRLLKIDLRERQLHYQRHGSALSVLGQSKYESNAKRILRKCETNQDDLDMCLILASQSADLSAAHFLLKLGANPHCKIDGYALEVCLKDLLASRRSNPKVWRRDVFYELKLDAIIECLWDPNWMQRGYSVLRK